MTHRTLLAAAVFLAVSSVRADPRTYVKLAGKDDSIPKLGLPGITVEVFGPRVEECAEVRAEIARALKETAHTRPVAAQEPGDYALAVTLVRPLAQLEAGTLPFEVVMASADGRTLWRVEGHTEVAADTEAKDVLAGIGRNVVSALVHDGWVAPLYNPDDPPPAPPNLRRTESGSPD